ncbi:hypothetical protein QJQ45_028871, partial [Haematococcus lacustris]
MRKLGTRGWPAPLSLLAAAGEGAFAVVEECEYSRGEGGRSRRVAVKRLRAETLSSPGDMAAFVREVAVLRKLRHPSIVEYVGVGCSDPSRPESTLFLVQVCAWSGLRGHKGDGTVLLLLLVLLAAQEYLGGGTLKSLVSRQMRQPHASVYSNADALRWSTQLAQALAYLHEARPKVRPGRRRRRRAGGGADWTWALELRPLALLPLPLPLLQVIHRDLKMDNVLLTEGDVQDKAVKLADCGLVALHPHLAPQGTLTPAGSEPAPPTTADMNTPLTPDPPKLKIRDRSVWSGRCEGQWGGARRMADIAGAEAWEVVVRRMSFLSHSSSRERGGAAPALRTCALKATHSVTGQTGSLMYMSPEMFRREPYTEAVDVFSFAVVVWAFMRPLDCPALRRYELFHRYLMVHAISLEGSEAEVEAYAHRVSRGFRPPIAERLGPELSSLLAQCWAQDPAARPPMTQVGCRAGGAGQAAPDL